MRYEQIGDIPGRLRWLRYSRRLLQAEVAAAIGMSVHAYKNIEADVVRQIPRETREKLAQYFGVAAEDFEDEFSRFLEDGQADRIRACRAKMELDRRAFAARFCIPLRSLEAWERGKKTISYKCWEKYFKGKA